MRHITHYLVVECPPCDGGLQLAAVEMGEEDDAVARRYGGCVRDYGRLGSDSYRTRAESLMILRDLEREEQ